MVVSSQRAAELGKRLRISWRLATLWTILLCMLLILVGQLYLAMVPWWCSYLFSNGGQAGAVFDLEGLLDGFSLRMVVFVWGPLLGIAVLSISSRSWPFKAAQPDCGTFDPSTLPPAETNAWHSIKQKATALLHYQLPPRTFWAWLLDNGFTVVDAIVVGLYLSMNGCWLYYGFTDFWTPLQAYHLETGLYRYGTLARDICRSLAYSGAWASMFNLLILFLPVPRSSFLHYLFNSDFSAVIKYHRWLGHGFLVLALFHGQCWYVDWWTHSSQRFLRETLSWDSDGANQLAGTLAIFPFGFLLWVTALPAFRKKFYQAFHVCHVVGFLGVVLFTQIHWPQGWVFLPGLVLYFLDVTFRLAQWRITSGMKCSFISADQTFCTLKLKFNKAAEARAGQFIFLNVPSISWWAMHPISIAAVHPNPDGLSQDVILHVKAFGTWTKALIARLLRDGSITVRAEGPFGKAADNVRKHGKQIVMIAGGIGVTPFLAMLEEIADVHEARKKVFDDEDFFASMQEKWGPTMPDLVTLVWVVRHREELSMIPARLLEIAREESWLRLDLYCTQKDISSTSGLRMPAVWLLQPPEQQVSHFDAIVANAPCLQPYSLGNYYWMLGHILALAGAFFACLAVTRWDLDVRKRDEIGLANWVYGPLLLLALVAGSMVIPGLLIFPMQARRSRKFAKEYRAWQAKPSTAPSEKLSELEMMEMVADGMCAANPGVESCCMVESSDHLRQYPLKGNGDDQDLEAGVPYTIHQGRPDLVALLAGTFVAALAGQKVSVMAAGSPGMISGSRQAMHKAIRVASKAVGKGGLPHVKFSEHSFSL